MPLIGKSRALCPGGRIPPSFIHQVIIITGLNRLYSVCCRPEYGLRCRQGIKPPSKLKSLHPEVGFYSLSKGDQQLIASPCTAGMAPSQLKGAIFCCSSMAPNLPKKHTKKLFNQFGAKPRVINADIGFKFHEFFFYLKR